MAIPGAIGDIHGVYLIGALIEKIEEFAWSDEIFIRGSDVISKDLTLCIVESGTEPSDLHSNSDCKCVAEFTKLLFSAADFQDIKANVISQMPSAEFDIILEAILHYQKFDAFIRLE